MLTAYMYIHVAFVFNPLRMRKGYGSLVCVCVCVSTLRATQFVQMLKVTYQWNMNDIFLFLTRECF